MQKRNNKRILSNDERINLREQIMKMIKDSKYEDPQLARAAGRSSSYFKQLRSGDYKSISAKTLSVVHETIIKLDKGNNEPAGGEIAKLTERLLANVIDNFEHLSIEKQQMLNDYSYFLKGGGSIRV